MSVLLSDKNVGDIVKIKENGAAVNFIIVHKGLPSAMYHSSCDGIWVLRQTTLASRAWDADSKNGGDYANSDIREWLEGDYLNTIDSKIRAAIKQVKIPYRPGTGSSTTVYSGSAGLSCRVFLLAAREVGFSTTSQRNFPADGAKLAYFLDSNSDTDAKAKRVAKNNSGTSVHWWLRTPLLVDESFVMGPLSDGAMNHWSIANADQIAVRPAFILPANLLVGSDGIVSTNTLTTISNDKAGDLGTLTSGFTCHYSVNDADEADSVSVTLTLDGVQKSKFTAVKNNRYTYSITGEDWLKITNGTHSLEISASDGKDTVTSTTAFTRNKTSLSVALESPFKSDDKITACFLKIIGSIPADAACKIEVTNNALDSSPVWEDCTLRIKAGLNYLFKNAKATKGFAFSFRMNISRGVSNLGGYITKITGGFE